MQVEVTRHVDSGEPDIAGKYEWRYEYDLYRFSDQEVTYVARSYIGEPSEAYFLRREHAGKACSLRQGDLVVPLFMQAVQYLRTSGKSKVNWLGVGGYVAVPQAA